MNYLPEQATSAPIRLTDIVYSGLADQTPKNTSHNSVESNLSLSKERESMLRALLDPPVTISPVTGSQGNFETAVDTGLIGMFAYEPDSQIDGLKHVLLGDVTTTEGTPQVGGFHINTNPDYAAQRGTREDRAFLADANANVRRNFRQLPFEPYSSRVVIEGAQKFKSTQMANGEIVTNPVNNSMFPVEYDALAVLNAVRIARDSRDRSQDIRSEEDVIVATGAAPMIDGSTEMPIHLVLNRQEQVITAFPKVKPSGYMKLTDMAIDRALGLDGIVQR